MNSNNFEFIRMFETTKSVVYVSQTIMGEDEYACICIRLYSTCVY